MSTILSILKFPHLTTTEDNGQRAELERLQQADVHARRMLISGPLVDTDMVGDPSWSRLLEAVASLFAAENPERPAAYTSTEDVDEVERIAWAYRIGLCAGLRLA